MENPNCGRLNYPLLKPHLLHKGNMVSFLLHNIGNGFLNSCLLYTIYYNCEIGTGNCTMDVRNDLVRGTQNHIKQLVCDPIQRNCLPARFLDAR